MDFATQRMLADRGRDSERPGLAAGIFPVVIPAAQPVIGANIALQLPKFR